MQSPYKSNGPKIVQKTSNDVRRPQKIEFIKPVSNADSAITRRTIKKNNMENGSVQKID